MFCLHFYVVGRDATLSVDTVTMLQFVPSMISCYVIVAVLIWMLHTCTKEEHCAVNPLCVCVWGGGAEVPGTEIHQRLTAHYGSIALPK